MTEKKNPEQKIVGDDFSDDDPIIELTDEVIIKPEEDRKVASPKTADFIPSKVDYGPSSGDGGGVIACDEKAKSSLPKDPLTETHGQIADDDSRIGLTDKFEPESPGNDDVLIMDKGQDELDGDSAAIIDDDAIEMTGDGTQNNFDEKIEIEYQIDGDEIDFFSEDDQMAEDIIEIAKFDRHFPDDDDKVLEHADLLDPSGPEGEEFLELFDIEEEGPMEDETAIANKAPQPVEKFSELDSDLDLAMAAAALSSGPRKIDLPDTPFPQDPANEKERTSFAGDPSEKDDPMQKDSSAANAGDSAVVSPEQIDQAIERIINQKLAGRIEHIIYEIIEKTVKKEIDRLKASLLEDSTPEDNL